MRYLITIFLSLRLVAQDPLQPTTGFLSQFVIEMGDTIPVIQLETVTVSTTYLFKSEKERKTYQRIREDVRKVYPYAVLISLNMKEINLELSKLVDEKQKELLLKKKEEELTKKFGSQLEALNFRQGKILFKLISRECHQTTYDILKSFKGRFKTGIYQGVSRLFGYNLKTEYDPVEDILIERAVREVVLGY